VVLDELELELELPDALAAAGARRYSGRIPSMPALACRP